MGKDDSVDIQIDGFEIQSVIGAGGAGTVYLAVQKNLDRQVALKVLKCPEGSVSSRRRFRREAQILASLSHPNLVRLFAYHEDPELPYLTMEYLPQGTLLDRLHAVPTGSQPGLPIASTMRLARDLLAAVITLHSSQLIHRDIKPSNILFRATGEAVLSDLGLVRPSSKDITRLTHQDGVMGTIAYVAPEVYRGVEMGVQTDLFALGVTLFEALTGRHPTDSTPFGVGYSPPDPATSRPQCPSSLRKLLVALMDPDPAARPSSARAALRILEERSSTRSIRAISTTHSTRRRLFWKALTLFVALGMIGVLASLLRSRPPRRPPPPALEVHAGSRGATVRISGTSAGLVLCVFDRSGKLLTAIGGQPASGHTEFVVRNLEPAGTYQGKVFARQPVPGSLPLSEVEFHTQPEVVVLGAEPGAIDPGIWLRVIPAARASWEQGEENWAVDDRGSRIPAGPLLRSPREWARLRLHFRTGDSMTLRLRVPKGGPALGERRPLGFGVVTTPTVSSMKDRTKERSFADWLVEERIRWVAYLPDDKGRPQLDARTIDDVFQRGGVRTIIGLRPQGEPGKLGWEEELQKLAAARKSNVLLSAERGWMADRWEFSAGPQAVASVVDWMQFVRHRFPGFSLLVLVPATVNWGHFEELSRLWASKIGTVDGFESMSTFDNEPTWILSGQFLRGSLANAGASVRVRWICFTKNRVSEVAGNPFNSAETDSPGPVRCYLLSRVHYPDAEILFDLEDLVVLPDKHLGGAWTLLETTARSLSGLMCELRLNRADVPRPRIESIQPVTALCFAGGGRRVQVLFSDGAKTRVRFLPARPGILKLSSHSSPGRYESQTHLTDAPMDLVIGGTPALYEELLPIEIVSETAGH